MPTESVHNFILFMMLFFETVFHKDDNKPPPIWDELIIKGRFRNDLENDESNLVDTWEKPSVVSDNSHGSMDPTMGNPAPRVENPGSMDPMKGNPAPGPVSMNPSAQLPKVMEKPVPVLRPTTDESRPPSTSQRETVESPSPPNESFDASDVDLPLRRSTRIKKPVDRFKFDKAHGYPLIKHFLGLLINTACTFNSVRSVYNANYIAALALDPTYGILQNINDVPPDFLNRNPWIFKSKAKKGPDTPGIREAITGEFRDEFIQGMANETAELESHDTWEVIKRSDIKPIIKADGAETIPRVIPLTWAFKIKCWPSGLLRKIKARISVRGDLQEDLVDPFETYAPVAAWSSIRMLTILSLQQHWVTKKIDFSNAFVQAPLEKDVYVALPALFEDASGIDSKELCLKLKKSLYGMKEAPKLWGDHLSKALDRCGFKPANEDLAVYYGRGMVIVVFVDDVLFFGLDESEMEKVINELQTDGFELKKGKEWR